MKIEVNTKNYVVPEKLQKLIDKKVAKLSKYLSDDSKIKVFCKSETVNKEIFTMEITVNSGKDILRAEVFSDNMYENLDNTLRKIERQIIKRNTKVLNKSKKEGIKERDFLFNDVIEEEPEHILIRTKSYQMKPISVEDAIEMLEALDHTFYVFQNDKSKQINVIYRRHDGNYGIIEAMM